MPALFDVEHRADGIAVITIDVPGERQNILTTEFVARGNELFDDLDGDRALKGVVITSSKPDSFIAGADIRMLADCQSAQEATALAQTGQAFCQRVANFKVPVAAAIDGVCLGGGLELALACHARVCSSRSVVSFGLPEVQIGLLPGSGGTQRLPRLIGLQRSLDLMLSGRRLTAAQAVRIGLVDEIVPPAVLMKAALRLLQVRKSNRTTYTAGQRLLSTVLQRVPRARHWFFSRVRSKIAVRTHGYSHYPAPEYIVESVETGLAKGIAAGLACEAQRFGELAMSAEAGQLIFLYFAANELKNTAGKDIDAETISSAGADQGAVDVSAPIRHVAVIGAGLMGAGISYISSRAGCSVRLKDIDDNSLLRGLKTIHGLISQRLKKHRLSAFEARQQQRQITPTLDYSGFHNVDLAIEAVDEDLALKQKILLDVEKHAKPDTIFASNTSSIPLQQIADVALRPANVIGMHYFSPVEKMPLLEVITTSQTGADTAAAARAFGRRQGKTVILVKDGAGFYVNRILAPYVNEAGILLEEGVSIAAIDQALLQFGFPVGPLALLDEVGIDVGASVGTVLYEAFGARMKPTRVAERMLADGRQGKKNKKGFYTYNSKKNKIPDASVSELLGVRTVTDMQSATISERCVLLMLNEAARCLEEGIIDSARDGDIGAVFGIGFPPFRGGPFRYVDSFGIKRIVTCLKDYGNTLGERYAPADSLLEMADQAQLFYPREHSAGSR